jgi:hypothetical protein
MHIDGKAGKLAGVFGCVDWELRCGKLTSFFELSDNMKKGS